MRVKQEAKPHHAEPAGHRSVSLAMPAQHTSQTTQVHRNSSVQVLDAFDPLCPLPGSSQAAQTTVITTTTQTTTTQFSPLMYRTPRDSNKRSSKQYPLADKPVPNDFKALFLADEQSVISASSVEHDMASAFLSQWSEIYPDLVNDSLTSATSQRQSSPHLVQQARRQKKRKAPEDTPDSSNTEGGDVDDDLPSNKKLRTMRMETAATGVSRTPVTPGTRGRRSRAKDGIPQLLHDSPLSLNGSASSSLDHTDQNRPRNTFPSTPLCHSQSTVAAPPSPPSFAESMVATPPVADEDMDPLGSFSESVNDTSKVHDSLLDTSTSSLKEPILPSPVASPVASPGNTSGTADHLDLDRDLIQLDNSRSVVHGNELALAEPNDTIPLHIANVHLASMMNFFEALPDSAQKYFIYQMLRRSDTSQLRFIAEQVNPALKCDFLSELPPELSLHIIRYLDVKSLSRAAQVSKKWRELIDTDDKAWRDLLERDGYQIPSGEVTRAIRESWQYQGLMPYEKDLSREIRSAGFQFASHFIAPPSSPTLSNRISEPQARHGKRRHITKSEHSQKRRKINETKMEPLSSKLDSPRMGESPKTLSADIPELGLKHLRIPHLYKTIYRRHHCIRKMWMDPESRPQHLAFRAHGRHVVTCLQFDDDKLLTGSDDTRIHVYNSSNGALRTVLDGHDGGVWALQYEGNTLVSGSTDRTVRVWDIEKGRCLHVFHGHTSTVRCLVILKPTIIGYDGDRPIWMPKRPLIITGSRDTSLRVWYLPKPGDAPFNPTGDILSEELNPYFIRALSGHTSSVRAIAAHGDTLVSGSYDNTVRVWKISTGEVLHRLNGHTSKVYSVILDHERKRCISGSMDTMVKVWSLETGACLLNLEGHTSLVGLLDLSHGRLVSAAADSSLRIWDPETGHCKSTLLAHTGAITCFQHDQQKVISGSDRALKLWNVQTGEIVKDLLVDLSGGWQIKFNDRKCVSAVQRGGRTYIEILDFGASRDGIPEDQLGERIVVDENGLEVEDYSDDDTVDD